MKSIQRSLFFTAFWIIVLTLISSNTFGQEGYKEWKEDYLNEFKKFQNEYDKQFHEMLKKEWKQFSVEVSPDFYEKPKPDVIPTTEGKDNDPEPETKIRLEQPKEKSGETKSNLQKEQVPKQEDDQKVDESSNQAANETESTPAQDANTATSLTEKGLTPSFEPNVEEASVKTNRLSYFDIPIHYKYYAAYEKRVNRPVVQESITNFWKHLSTKDYPPFLDQIEEVRARLSLNDYGYAQLLQNIGEQIYGIGTPEATLFTWFMLTQSGFGTRVAYNDENVYLLTKTTPDVFKTTYFMIDGEKYYGINFSKSTSKLPSNLFTYEGDYPKSDSRDLSLLFSRLPMLPEKQESRTLSFSYHDTSYTFSVPVDQQVVRYFKSYPKAQLDLYFNSRMRGEMHQELMNSLRPLIKGKSNVEKANILLRFVQKAFDYETDQKQFNTEKKMFPAEALYYPANDCDDRSILFAYLIEHLTDLEYIVLRYPGHLTPALHFPSNPPSGSEVGPPVQHDGKNYYVSDPTYFGADAGMIMSQYQDSQPSEIFDL